MKTIHERIKKLRKDHGWSQEELARKIGYADKTSIAKIEAGKVDLPQSKLIALSEALDATTSYLLHGENTDSAHTVAAHLDTDSLSEAELRDVADYIEFIKNRKSK